MKQKIKQEIEVEIQVCNICKKEIHERGYEVYLKRVQFVRGLFKTTDFDAHPNCLNRKIREAFKKYI